MLELYTSRVGFCRSFEFTCAQREKGERAEGRGERGEGREERGEDAPGREGRGRERCSYCRRCGSRLVECE